MTYMQENDRCLIESSIVSLPGSETFAAPSYEDLVSVISYLAQVPEENIRKLGFTVVIDARKALQKQVRTALRACQQALFRCIRLVLIVQPEKFLEQQKINFELIKEAYSFKSMLTSVHKLSRFVDVTHLPDILGGTLHYDPHSWVLLREKFENYVAKANSWIKTKKRHDKTSTAASDEKTEKVNTLSCSQFLRLGDDLVEELEQNSDKLVARRSNEWNCAASYIRSLMKQIKDIEERPAVEARWAEQNASLKLLEEHAQGVHNLVDWIVGAGERWLLTLHEIGESYDDAKQLLKELNELENKSTSKLQEVKEQSHELAAVGRELQRDFPGHATTLQQSTERIQQVTRAFCARVARQKDVVLRSVNFYRMLNDFSRKTDLLLESMCTDLKAIDIASAEMEREEMMAKVEEMEKIYSDVVSSGVSFIDELCMDELNSMGRPVTRDYSAGIVHIRERLEEIRDRRRRCQSLADVRRLKIQQLLQLYTCEKDGQQAVLWIEELYETIVNEYNEVGCNAERLCVLRENKMKVEETARSTYEYGKQLCQVALVLRRSLRMEVQAVLKLNQRLESVWGRLCYALSENETKHGISDAFYATIRKANKNLDELSKRLDQRALDGASVQWFVKERKIIADDIRDLKHIADVLVQELNIKPTRSKNKGAEQAVNEIQRRFGEMKLKQKKLEGIWEDDECSAVNTLSGSEARLLDDNAASGSVSAGGSSALSNSTSPYSGDYILQHDDCPS